MASTLLLDSSWDLTVNVYGNIAVADTPYALAQDAASAIKLFKGELWYDTTKGVPYWSDILGFAPPIPLMKDRFVAAALTVPGVTAARCFISSFVNRVIGGQVQITDKTGQTSAVAF